MFEELCGQMHRFYTERRKGLKTLDREREANPDWYKKNDMMGMMLYVDNFAGNLKGVESKLDYLEESGVNYVHLMPLLETPKGRSDGGYAVSNFRKVQPELGTMDDLEDLTKACHDKKISVLHGLRYEPYFRGSRMGSPRKKRRGRVYEPLLLL